MNEAKNIRRLMTNHQRRLQVLKEKQALLGLSAPAELIIEIEDTSAKILNLQAQLNNLPRIFISYKRNAEPDEPVALRVLEALKPECFVFVDLMMPVGTLWAERIEAELKRSDFLIVFLSAESVHSEMVEVEIATAHRLMKEQGRPTILPVRLAYREPFQYPLSVYLDPINWAFLEKETDLAALIDELRYAISGSPLSIDAHSKADLLRIDQTDPWPVPLASAQPLESPEGTMSAESQFYIEREGDAIALEAILGQGETITIKGPRQMGKSSLLNRVKTAAIEANKTVVYLDFQLFDTSTLASADEFLRQFCAWLTYELDIEDRLEKFWNRPFSYTLRCTQYVGNYLLQALNTPLVLAMDEVDRLFDTDYRSDFFGMLRSWHNSRKVNAIWKRLDLAMVTSTEPYQFIDDLNQSPFNVGEIITLRDFTLEEVADLNRRHNLPLRPDQMEQFNGLLAGHPYLVRRGLYLLARNRISVDDLFKQALDDYGPFGDHLKRYLFNLHDRPELTKALQQVIRHQTCPDEQIAHRLEGAGLIRKKAQAVLPRCKLYADYFRSRLDV